MDFVIPGVLIRNDPTVETLPLVFDSPHSGADYPVEFQPACDIQTLRQSEDTYVDELFGAASDHGATFLKALFPRTFIDVNRSDDDIDEEMLEDAWPEPLNPSEKSMLGMGLIRRLCRPGVPLYARRLTVAEVQDRIERYYRPYHDQLGQAIRDLHQAFGSVWHINCHSMPSGGSQVMRDRIDFVLGDRDGTTSSPAFTKYVAERLRRMGYTVRLNDPYKGVELVRRYSAPTRGRHSLQIEVNRRLYMNEETLERLPSFAQIQADMTNLIEDVADYARSILRRRAAE